MPIKDSEIILNANEGTAITTNLAPPIQETTGGKAYGGQALSSRTARNIAPDDRNANFDTLFHFFIDRVEQPSDILRKDPEAIKHMRTDLQINSCMTLRKLSVAMLKRQWVPSEKDKSGEIARKFEKWFDAMYKPTDFIMNLMEAVWQGCSILELVWSINDDGEFYVKRAYHCANDRFLFNKVGQLAIKTRQDPYWGQFVNYDKGKPVENPFQFIWHIHNPTGGSWSNPREEAQQYWGRGLMEDVWPTYYAKTVALNMSEKFLEFLAGGKVVMRYPQGQTRAQDQAIAVAKQMQDGAAIAIPSGMSGNDKNWELQFMTGPANPGQAFWEYIAYLDKVIAKYTLGTTMVNDSGNIGTQSSPETQIPNTFGRVNKYDISNIEETLRTMLITAYGTVNGIPKELWPTVTFAQSVVMEAPKLIPVFSTMQQMGVKVSPEMLTEYLGIRQIREGEEAIEPVNPNPNDPAAGKPPKKANGGSGAAKKKKAGRS